MEDDSPAWVKICSCDGAEFYVDRQCAMISGTIKAMLQGQFAESKGEITLMEIDSKILEKVVKYMYYRARYTNSTTRIPEFEIEPELALDLLMASNFLDL